jgi:hypothetical protein
MEEDGWARRRRSEVREDGGGEEEERRVSLGYYTDILTISRADAKSRIHVGAVALHNSAPFTAFQELEI